MDAGYKTAPICKKILDDTNIPILPYKRPMGKKGFFPTKDFYYDEYYDCVLCPQNQILSYVTTTREGYKEFRGKKSICASCPQRTKCFSGNQRFKTTFKHIWSEYLEISEDIRHSGKGKAYYAKRSETIERVFADAKEKHGFRYTTYRGKAKMQMKALLTYAAMNLKKMALWAEKQRNSPLFFAILDPICSQTTKKSQKRRQPQIFVC
jgi:transposase DDE domain